MCVGREKGRGEEEWCVCRRENGRDNVLIGRAQGFVLRLFVEMYMKMA